MHVIADGHCLRHLAYLLEFLVAWERRPVYLTSMAYQWCCAISEAVARLGPDKIPIRREAQELFQTILRLGFQLRHLLGSQPEDPLVDDKALYLLPISEEGFSMVGLGCDPIRLDNTSLRAHSRRQDVTLLNYADLLRMALNIGFRLAGPGRDQPAVLLGHPSHNNQMFEVTFSSDEDDVIADAVCAWIADRDVTPPSSFFCYFTKRVEDEKAFSERLQWASVRAIECIWRGDLGVPGLETARLLNRLKVNVDDMVDKQKWRRLLISTIRSTTGQESLSSHHWHSLDKLISELGLYEDFVFRDVEVMEFLEEAEDWERLEVWMSILWKSLGIFDRPTSESMQKIEQTNLKLLLCRPSAIPRFEDMVGRLLQSTGDKTLLRRICDRALSEQLPSQSPPLQ